MAVLAGLTTWARNIKRDVVALWIAARDPRVPWHAKAVAAAVTAYALSSIDLFPDVVAVLGYLDNLLIVPLGILLAVRPTSGAVPAGTFAIRDDASVSVARVGLNWKFNTIGF